MSVYRRGYHRVSDDSISSTVLASKDAAIVDANAVFTDPDVDEVWVTEDGLSTVYLLP